MISFWAGRDQNCLTIKSPLTFFANLFKKKKYKVRKSNVKDIIKSGNSNKVPTVLSVSVMDMSASSPNPLSPALSVLTLTPGRTRDIDQDMEALRLSRQDNPFLQVLASRESLVESLFESESDDTNLMSQDLPNELEVDPLSMPEIHEHMIRSPPPTTWPKSPNYKVFRFPESDSEEGLQANHNQFRSFGKSSLKNMSLNSVRDQEERMSKDFKYNELPDNYIKTHSTIHSIKSSTSNGENPHKRSKSECREDNIFPVLRGTSIRSPSDILHSQFHENFQDQK